MYTTEAKDPDARFSQSRLETIISWDKFLRLPSLFSCLLRKGDDSIYLSRVSIGCGNTNEVLSTPLDEEQGLAEHYFWLLIVVVCIFYYTT